MENQPPEIPKPTKPTDAFQTHFNALNKKDLFPVIDAVLKRPSQVVFELLKEKNRKVALLLTLLFIICLSGIGLMMGSFSGGAQLWAAPVKIILGTTLSAAICLPSLYILLCLSGGAQSFPETAKLLILGLVLAGILFIGFMPVAWIFSQATDAAVFMGILYLIIWGIGLFFGFRLMKTSFRFLNKTGMGALNLWFIIFIMVLLQMSTTLRPIIGEHEPLNLSEKKFFLAHWGDVIDQ